MRRVTRHAVVMGAIAALLLTASRAMAQQAAPMSRVEFDALFARVNNAGRWGDTDRLGTLNLVTPELRRAAVTEVREGSTVSLTRAVVPGPLPGTFEPAGVDVMMLSDTVLGPADGSVTWSAERLTLFYHGWAFTHIDALNHLSYRGRGYNGAQVPAAVDAMRGGLVTRGVLVDLPQLRDSQSGPVTSAELEAWERRTNIRIKRGDVVLIHSGRWEGSAAPGVAAAAGIHPATSAWLREREVVAVGVEGSTDGTPSLVPGITSPFHVLALVAMGMPQLENLDLTELAHQAAARKRWSFLLVIAPLDVQHGTGSPVNPLAVF
jgi:kynurenine formamidase